VAGSATKGVTIRTAIIAPVPVEETDMITRRTFLQTAASGSVASPLATPTEANASPGTVDRSRPLRAEPRLRVLKARRETWTRGSLRLYSDGPLDPPPLIRPEVLDAAFGKGVGRSLHQPDH
jgi:hypothetical protein